jgi:putative transcriptional regulator
MELDMHRYRIARLLALALVPIGVFYFAGAPRAETYDDQAVVLVAHPGLRDAAWAQTVLLAAPARGGWHIGVIINRPTERSLASLFPRHEPSKSVRDPVYNGGPYGTEAIVALVKGAPVPGSEALPLAEGLYLAIDAPTIDRVIETTPSDARFFIGFVAWRPGELQQEVERGLWSLRDADRGIIFSKDATGLWHDLRHNASETRAALGQ